MDLWVCQLGRVEYREALALQHRLREARQAGHVPDTLLLLEHDPVYTLGRRSEPGELPMGEGWYREQGIDIVETQRGGKLTFHGPGQLVGYPVMAIDDVVGYVATLERAMVAALADEGVAARGRSAEARELTGAWVGDRKIGAIGIHVSRGVTTHGFAVNVTTDLRPFEWAVACGLGDVETTSVERERGSADLGCFRKRMAHRFAEAVGRRQRLVSRARLERALAAEPAQV